MNNVLENQNIVKRHRSLFILVRKVKRVLLRVSYVLLPVLVVLGLAWGITQSGTFALQKVDIVGDFQNVSLEEIQKAADLSLERNLFQISLQKIEKNILTLKWVDQVLIRRQVPHALWIHVKEHEPRALLLDKRLYFVSKEGTVFKEVERETIRDLPVITGLKKEDAMREVLHLIDFFSARDDFSVFGLSEIHYNEPAGFSFVTMTGPTEIRLGRENFEKKLDRLQTIWSRVKPELGRIKGVDLDYEDRAFVKL